MIALIDYGISNLRSVQKAFEHLDTEVTLVDTPDRLAQADRLILPGVGAFPAGMKGLQERGLIEPIKQAAPSGGMIVVELTGSVRIRICGSAPPLLVSAVLKALR